MKKPSVPDSDWSRLREQIIGLGEESHKKNYYPALKQSRDDLVRFRGVIEEIPDMILITDEKGDILDMNRAAESVFSKSRRELMQMNAKELVEGQFEEISSDEQAGENRNKIYFTDEQGTKVYRELDARTVSVGYRQFWVLFGRDVTNRFIMEEELKKLNETLEEEVLRRTESIEQQMVLLRETQEQLIISEKMAVLGTLVAGVAHEINNPLGIGITASSALEGQVAALNRAVENGELTEEAFTDFLSDLKESARLIQKNLERAGDLVKSFKQVAVDQSNEQNRKINLLEYLREVVQSLYPQWKKHSVVITGDSSILLETIPGDWSQIITNLILNSITHGFCDRMQGGCVSIELIREKSFLTLIYRDDGKGIDDGQAERIFDPFYTTARDSGGTGLGMHIVYNIISLRMGGSIRYIREDTPGVCFRIQVPI